MLPQVDSLGRVYALDAGVPVFWNGGIGYTADGRLCTTTIVPGPNSRVVNGFAVSNIGRLIIQPPSGPAFSIGGLPFNADGAMTFQWDTVPLATDPYVGGIRVGAAGVYLTTTPIIGFLEEMSVDHELLVGINPAGTRVGYRRNEWGAWSPDDVPSLERLFTNLNNNRLVVQATGDKSALVISNIHIVRFLPHTVHDFGPPSSVVYDGVFTDFTWIVPGFDFVLGESYEVSLS